MDIGQRIKEARKKAGLTQKELAERASVATVSIQQYERGARQPRLEQLRQIALALGTSVSELVELGYWGSLSQEEREEMWGSGHATIAPPQQRINARIVDAASQLSEKGQEKVADYAEDLLPKYPRQAAPSAPSPAPEGSDTTPPPGGSEGPPEGE